MHVDLLKIQRFREKTFFSLPLWHEMGGGGIPMKITLTSIYSLQTSETLFDAMFFKLISNHQCTWLQFSYESKG